MKHPHAEKMMEYAQDAMTTETPWKLWEFKSPENEKWERLFTNPAWTPRNKYRRAPTVEFKEIHESNYIKAMDYKYGNLVSPEPVKPHK